MDMYFEDPSVDTEIECSSFKERLSSENNQIIKNKVDDKVLKDELMQEKYNIYEGNKRTRIHAKVGDRKLMFDDRMLRNLFPMEIKEVKREDNLILYDKYNRVINPYTGNTMKCCSIYVNAVSERCPIEEAQYVEFLDVKEGKHYFYIAELNKGVYQQIKEDTESLKKHQMKISEEKDEYGVIKQYSDEKQCENIGYNGGLKKW